VRKFFLLLLLIFMSIFPAWAQEEAPYNARTSAEAPLYQVMDKKSAPIGSLRKNMNIEVLEVHPDWLLVRADDRQGYIRRKNIHLNDVTRTDLGAAPFYAAVPCTYLAWVKGTAQVMDSPNANATELIALHDGARVALIDIEDGWARLIFKRQYGYINTNQLGELEMINATLEGPNPDGPIAAYTSFYLTTQSEINIGRIKNLQVSCDKFASMEIAPGETFDFNRDLGPYRASNGYFPAIVLVGGKSVTGYGGGTCQVSSTLYNVVLQMPGIEIVHRRAHGPGGISYLPLGADAAVGTKTQNFIFRNHYPFPVRIDGTVQDGALTLAVYQVRTQSGI